MAKMADVDKSLDIRTLISLIILGVATLFQLIALFTNHWVSTFSETYGTIGYNGLWQTCTNMGNDLNSCRGFTWEDNQVSHWFRTVQALELIGWTLGSVALGMILLYHFVGTCMTNRKLKILSIVQCILAFCCLISADITIWCLNDVLSVAMVPDAETYMSWSFVLGMLSTILYLISGIAIFIS